MANESSSMTASASSDRCSVIGCPSHTSRIKNISFHSCPNNSVTQKLWLQSLKLDPTVSIVDAIVCSEHFDPSCFKRCGNTVELRDGSIPAVKLKRKIRPNPKYADEVPSKKFKTEIKVETDSDEFEADSPEKNAEIAEVMEEMDSTAVQTAEIVKRRSASNVSSSEELKDGNDVVYKSTDGTIIVKRESAEASTSNTVASNSIFKGTPTKTTVKDIIRENIISKTLSSNTIIEDSYSISKAIPDKTTVKELIRENIILKTTVEDSQNGSTPGVSKVVSKDSKPKKSTVKDLLKESSLGKKRVCKKIMASDEEVAQWVKDYKAESLAKQEKMRLEKSQMTGASSSRNLPVTSPPSNGAPRRFASKLSQCVNEEDDDAHYVISKINFAMMFVQSQDRKIKELNDRYVELTRENDELREEHGLLRAQITSAAKLGLQAKTGGLSKAIVVSKPVTSTGTIHVAVPVAVSSNVQPNVSSTLAKTVTTTTVPASTLTGATAMSSIVNSNLTKPRGSVIIIKRKDSVEPSNFNKSNLGGGDSINASSSIL